MIGGGIYFERETLEREIERVNAELGVDAE